jgi:uncharacterized protein YqgV (UPF0045/DUF77 family)
MEAQTQKLTKILIRLIKILKEATLNVEYNPHTDATTYEFDVDHEELYRLIQELEQD